MMPNKVKKTTKSVVIQSQTHDCFEAIPTWSKDKCFQVLDLSDTTLKNVYGDKSKNITGGKVRTAILTRLQALVDSEHQYQQHSTTARASPTPEASNHIVELINLQKYLIELCCPLFPRHPPIMQAASMTFQDQVKSLQQHNFHLLSIIQQHMASTGPPLLETEASPPPTMQPVSTPLTEQTSHQASPEKSILKKQAQIQDLVQPNKNDTNTEANIVFEGLAALAQTAPDPITSSASTQLEPRLTEEDNNNDTESEEDDSNNNWGNHASNGPVPQQSQ